MTEDYLHHIWKHRLYDATGLKTTDGQALTIIQNGAHNPNAGPDFLEARLKIGEEKWAGHIELHVRSSDWNKHNHQNDKAYNNVVLHVVYEDDAQVFRESGTAIPTLQLKGRFDELGYWHYEQFISNKRFLACENLLQTVDYIHHENMLNRVLIARFEEKSQMILQIYSASGNDWNETFYHMLIYAFGLKINAEAMRVLASRVPMRLLRKHSGNQAQIEALLLGTAGLLKVVDSYSESLIQEYSFLRHKYALAPMSSTHFKFARLRPISFPTIRLAQLSGIFAHQSDLFRLCVESKNSDAIKAALQIEPHSYWKTHYTFGKASAPKTKQPAAGLINLVMINAVVPTLFTYAKTIGNQALQQQALDWLYTLPPEKNSIISNLRQAGFNMKSAYQTQAGLQLYRTFCRQRKCLTCTIGVKLLRS